MIMLEEFRRRKNLKDYHSAMVDERRRVAINQKMPETAPMDGKPNTHEYWGSGPERYFEP